MQSAAIHYFSGTGNTHRAATFVAEKLKSAGYFVDIYRVSEFTDPPAKPYNLHVFAFPVYALDVPHLMLRYLRRLPRDSARAAVIAIFGDLGPDAKLGGYEGNALTRARKVLRGKGYDVFLTDALGYPHSITVALDPPKREDQETIRARSDKEMEEIADYVARLSSSLKPESPLNPLYGLFGTMYRTFGRRALGKLYVADATCNGCGKCVRSCPAGIIALAGGRPQWGWECEGCQRCINACPSRSIQTSIVRLAGQLALAAFALVSFIVILILPYRSVFADWTSGPVAISGWLPGFALMLPVWAVVNYGLGRYVVEGLIRMGERNRGLWPIFHATFTRGYRRYMDPGFAPLEPLPQAPGRKR